VAQTVIRCSHLGAWERLPVQAQERRVQFGMTLPSLDIHPP
jgi:hypothetical protein